MSPVNYKLIAELVRRTIKPDPLQNVSLQFLGRSLDARWSQAELVYSVQPSLARTGAKPLETICIFSSGEDSLDYDVVSGIVNANRGARVLLVRSSSELPTPIEELQISIKTFLIVTELSHAKETAVLLISLCAAPGFEADHLSTIILKFFRWIGFTGGTDLPVAPQQILATALRTQNVHRVSLHGQWQAIELRSIYPVLQDVSDFRALVIVGRLFGTEVLFYKETTHKQLQEEVHRVRALVLSITALEKGRRL